MALTEDVKEVIYQMILIEQILRKTSPMHRMGDEDSRRVSEAIARSEAILKAMKEKERDTA